MNHRTTVAREKRAPSDTPRDVSEALLDAFRDLLFERGYRRITVRDLIARAGVARSTFYEYFDDKSDVLRQSIGPLFAVLAQCFDCERCPERLAFIMRHFWENRRMLALMLADPVRPLLLRFLADEIRSARREGRADDLTVSFFAGAQLAFLQAWLSQSPPIAVAAAAQALFEISKALRYASPCMAGFSKTLV